MTDRECNWRVTFARPFRLKGLAGVQPCGSYSVMTREASAEVFARRRRKRWTTWIAIGRNPGGSGALQFVVIDKFDLLAALLRDGLRAEPASA